MSEKVLEMWHAGFNPNQIAARLMIHKHVVEQIIKSGGPVPTPVVNIQKPKPKKKAAAVRKQIK